LAVFGVGGLDGDRVVWCDTPMSIKSVRDLDSWPLLLGRAKTLETLGISKPTLETLVHQGQIRVVRLGRNRRFNRLDVQRLVGG